MDGSWISGFVDGEGSFVGRIQKNSKTSGSKTKERKTDRRYSWGTADKTFVVEFSITLRADDIDVLHKINNYFGGVAYVKESNRSKPTTSNQVTKNAHFSIKKKGDLHDLVIPHFEEYPLQSKKANDFEIWKEIVEILHHRTQKCYTPYMYQYLTKLVEVLKHNRVYGNDIIKVDTILPQLHYYGSSEELENLFKERLYYVK